MKLNSKMNLTKDEIEYIENLYIKNKKSHDVLFEMYKDISTALKKAKIEYVVVGGTNLGAVLYQDFIPWDDDFDLAINYKDKNKLFNNLQKYLPPKYELVNALNNKGYQYAFPKIINKEHQFSKKEFGENKKYSYAFVDITMYKPTNRKTKTWRSRFFGKWLWLRGANINWFIDILMSIFKVLPQKFIANQIYKSFEKSKGNKYMMEVNPYVKKENDIPFKIDGKCKAKFRNITVPIIENYEEFFAHHYKQPIGKIYKLPTKKINHGLEI